MATDDPSNPWSASGWNVTGQMHYHTQHGPARASARAADAGTSVGGKRPKGGASQGTGDGGPQRTAIIKHISSGWSPLLAVITSGARRVLRVIGWTGGQGQTPAVGKYLGASGFVNTAAEATDIRGPAGADGSGGGGASSLALILKVGG